MTGTFLVWVALGASIVGMLTYARAAFGKGRSIPLARWSVLTSALGVAAASVLLMTYILQHRFDVDYVWSYSSRDLPTYLLITTFWAGQEGSFLLWALFGAAFGLMLQSYARQRKLEYEAMAVYGFLQSFLILLLVFKSPFSAVWDVHPDQLTVGQIPADGRGLNPLLQNMWMAIHPPILFIGFASLAVPFALAIASLWKRVYTEWHTIAMPWVLFAVVSLAAGIMLGGYWAYGVLGWGGWWGWDPVENSSLIPWIVSVALLHSIIVQKKNGGFVRTNFVLAILSYILVIYSTFLTRSGVLGDASVHSFVDPGTFVYTLLIVWVSSLVLMAVWALRTRWRDLRPPGAVTGILRKDTMLGWTSVVLLFLALLVFVGTNWPIISSGTVEPAFYNKSTAPLGILLALVLAVSLSLQWEEIPLIVALRRMSVPFAAAAVVTLAALFMGVSDVVPLVLTLVSAFALFMSIRMLFSMLYVEWISIGGPVAHAGLAILLLGIVGSGYYGKQQTVSLPLGEPQEVLGYTLNYTGAKQLMNDRWQFTVTARSEDREDDLRPVMFHSDYNNSVMRNPDYVSFLTNDLYIEPVSVETPKQEATGEMVHLARGKGTTFGPYTLTFEAFDMQSHTGGTMGGNDVAIGARILVKKGKSVTTVLPVSVFNQGDVSSSTPALLENGTELRLMGMNVDMTTRVSTVILQATAPGAVQIASKETLVVEASVKPFISLVWLGTVICLAGVAVALIRRQRDLRAIKEPNPLPRKEVAARESIPA